MTITGIKFRTAAPPGQWASFKATAASPGVTGGHMDKIHDTVGVYFEDADTGDAVAFVYKCEKIMVPKNVVSTDVFQIGDKVYYDASTKKATATVGSNQIIGIATEVALAAATEVEIDLQGYIT